MEVTFVYSLKPLLEDEELQLVYTGPPLALQDDFRLSADFVELVLGSQANDV